MNRLQKKCVIASAGLHSLLVLVLFVGPAFLPSKAPPPADNMPILDFIPFKTTDEMISGGGSRNGGTPPPPPPPVYTPPEPAVTAPPEVRPTPEPANPEPVKVEPEPSLEPAPKKARKPEPSLKQIVRKSDAKAEAKARAAAEAREEARALADYRERVASTFGKAEARIKSGMSSGVGIDPNSFKGPGGGGVPYANFYQAVKSIYANAWVVPDGVTDDDATTTAMITIARDGRIVSARISHTSGNVAIDRSVQVVLERVTKVPPLPETAKEDQRTVTIFFNARARRALG